MVLEVAILDVKIGEEELFEKTFLEAEKIISIMSGYISHELQKCIENNSHYLLLVKWETLEDHKIGFRQSKEYQRWKDLLHHFYDPFPTVEHFKII